MNDGYDEFSRRYQPNNDDSLDNLLNSIMFKEKLIKSQLKTNIIAWRGILTKLLCLPWLHDEPLTLKLRKFQGTVFIQMPKNQEQQHINRSMYYGYNFERLCTRSINGSMANCVDTDVQYCSVISTKIGTVRIVCGGEVDCSLSISKQEKNPLSNYIELKTSLVFQNINQQERFYSQKLLRIWAQSFLLGIEKIAIGFRDRKGILLDIMYLDTQKIPRMVRDNSSGNSPAWDGQTALTWLGYILEIIVNNVEEGQSCYLKCPAGSSQLSLEPCSPQDIILESFVQHRMAMGTFNP